MIISRLAACGAHSASAAAQQAQQSLPMSLWSHTPVGNRRGTGRTRFVERGFRISGSVEGAEKELDTHCRLLCTPEPDKAI